MLSPSQQICSRLIQHGRYCTLRYTSFTRHSSDPAHLICHKIQRTLDPEIPVCSASSLTVQHLSASTHNSIMTTNMPLWMDTGHTLQYTSATEALRHPSACNHLAAVSHSVPLPPLLPAALHGTSVHFYHETPLLSYMNTVPCYRLPLPNEVPNTDTTHNTCALPDISLCLW